MPLHAEIQQNYFYVTAGASEFWVCSWSLQEVVWSLDFPKNLYGFLRFADAQIL